MDTEVLTGYEVKVGKAWPEARVIRLPEKEPPAEPIVLVKRNTGSLVGPNGEDLAVFTGYPTISLFTGAGGFDLGVEQAGFSVVVQHECDGTCCRTLIANRPRAFRYAALIQGNICATPTSMLLREANLRVGEPYLLIGGPPCQGFSTQNSKVWAQGYKDIRNDLVFEFLRVAREAQPRFFMFENVPGFVYLNKGKYLRAFLEAAEDVCGDAAELLLPSGRLSIGALLKGIEHGFGGAAAQRLADRIREECVLLSAMPASGKTTSQYRRVKRCPACGETR